MGNPSNRPRTAGTSPGHEFPIPPLIYVPLRFKGTHPFIIRARLIRKVYEAEPLECPKCKGSMRVIALIDDPPVVRRILEHLGRWQPEAMKRSPPVLPETWPANAGIADHAIAAAKRRPAQCL